MNLIKIDAKAKKGLSQNFLIDQKVIEKIIQTADVKPGELILEIGPGPGALTSALLKAKAKVFAIELDPAFAQELQAINNENLRVIHADFLKFPLETMPKRLKIVANLPYHITTPILEKIFASSFSSITIMVQKEVADRMIASAGSKTFGSLSLFTQFYSQFHSAFTVQATSFSPKPKVDSTVLRLDSRPIPPVDPTRFFALVHKAFQQRRKMVTSTLGLDKEIVRNALKKIGMRPDARPENLSLEAWICLFEELKEKVS